LRRSFSQIAIHWSPQFKNFFLGRKKSYQNRLRFQSFKIITSDWVRIHPSFSKTPLASLGWWEESFLADKPFLYFKICQIFSCHAIYFAGWSALRAASFDLVPLFLFFFWISKVSSRLPSPCVKDNQLFEFVQNQKKSFWVQIYFSSVPPINSFFQVCQECCGLLG